MEQYKKIYKSVLQHYEDEVPMDICEPQFTNFLNIHGKYDEVSIYYSGQDKDVCIDDVIDLTTDYLVAKGFENIANLSGKQGVIFAFDHKFISKRQFISMDYLVDFLEKKGFDCSWYKTEREIVLRKAKIHIGTNP